MKPADRLVWCKNGCGHNLHTTCWEEWAPSSDAGAGHAIGDLDANHEGEEEQDEEDWAQDAGVEIFEPGIGYFDGVSVEDEQDWTYAIIDATVEQEELFSGILGSYETQQEQQAANTAFFTDLGYGDMMVDFVAPELEPGDPPVNDAEAAELRCVICPAISEPATCPCDDSTAHNHGPNKPSTKADSNAA